MNVQIDENLKRVFAEDAEQELPPRLMALLEQLGQVDAPGAAREDGTDEDATS